MGLMYEELTGEILNAAIRVHTTLGPGFLESIYENALAFELTKRGIPFETQVQVPILYEGHQVGYHRVDMIVNRTVILELKSVSDLHPVHWAVVLSYLRAANLPVALLLNFNKTRLEIKRFSL